MSKSTLFRNHHFGSRNAADNLSTKVCVPNKKNVSLKVFKKIAKICQAKTLVKHILCGCKSKFNSTTCNSNLKWNNDKFQCECA